jgi:hypothetical protein
MVDFLGPLALMRWCARIHGPIGSSQRQPNTKMLPSSHPNNSQARPLKPGDQIDVPTMHANEFDHEWEDAVSNAALLVVGLVVSYVAFYAASLVVTHNHQGFNRFMSPIASTVTELVPVSIEFGLFVFLTHSVFLLPAHPAIRYVVVFGTSIAIWFQVGFCYGTEMLSSFVLFVFIPLSVSLGITGWMLQRFTGARLTLRGRAVHERGISVRDYLVLAPLLLLMGVEPAVMWEIFGGASASRYSTALIEFALGLFAISAILLVCCYGFFVFLGSGWKVRIALGVSISAVFVFAACVEIPLSFQGFPYYSVWSLVAFVAFLAGVALAYLPFHLVGFRFVRAKRLVPAAEVENMSFDDIDRADDGSI